MLEPVSDAWCPPDEGRYAYLLGCYLGDGHINHKLPNTWTLRVSCDPRYPAIEAEIADAMQATFLGALARSHSPRGGSVDVLSLTSPYVRAAFPQHGPGRKHERSIVLAAWQREITRVQPAQLVRGLIHSDGCRTVNRFRTRLPSGRLAEYSYVRYFFSNLSADIREIFRSHCELLGIRVTQPNHRNLAVQHRASVAILDRYVGPKR